MKKEKREGGSKVKEKEGRKEGRKETAKKRLGKMRGYLNGDWGALSEETAQKILDIIEIAMREKANGKTYVRLKD